KQTLSTLAIVTFFSLIYAGGESSSRADDCLPTPPCRVSENNSYIVHFQIPDYVNLVSGPIGHHYMEHEANYPTYTLPLTFLWDGLALGKYLDVPKPSDCDSRDITFTRNNASCRYDDTFEWKGNAQTLNSKAGSLGDMSISLTIPRRLRGLTDV